MHHIFINENEIDLANKLIEISSESENYTHLVKSLRVEVNEMVLCSVVFDVGANDNNGAHTVRPYDSVVANDNNGAHTVRPYDSVVANDNSGAHTVRPYDSVVANDNNGAHTVRPYDSVATNIIPPLSDSFDYRAKVLTISDKKLVLCIIERTEPRELGVEINLYQGITKSDKLEFIIDNAVELGVKSITPVAMEFCIAKIDEKKSDKKIERYNKISKSAAEQSKRHIVPIVNTPISFAQMIKKIVDEKNKSDENITIVNNLLFYENADGIIGTREKISNIVKALKNNKNIIVNVIIGPEGGVSEKEIAFASENNVDILSLGDRILRTETAAIVALSILMYEFE